ncbi:Hexose_transporter [Hexamita inflata]|uniref:Hexose transporter n=1 Tax=Hexamita inflata TaxID=28002 RepID=A0AA86THH5_9EUKA|nr:Hexose transporter [Hexamita inflata]
MDKITKIISFLSSLLYGVVLTNLPVEIFDKIGEVTKFDVHNPTITSMVEFGFLAGALIGSMTIPLYVNKLGYVRSFRLLFFLEAIASGLTMIPLGWVYLSFTRILSGVFASSILMMAPQLVAEVLSAHQRGFTMMMFSIALNLGNELAYAIHLPIAMNYDFWQCTFALPIVLSLFGCVCSHLLLKKERLISKMTLNEPKRDQYQEKQPHERKLTKKQFSRLLFVTFTLGATPTMTGVDAILTYASNIFTKTFSSKYSGIYGSLILGALNIFFGIVATPFAERNPRKRMLFIGVIGIVASLFGLGLVYMLELPEKTATILILVFITLYLLFFNAGPQPIVFMFFGEMFPELYKVKLNSIGYASTFLSSVGTVYAFAYFTGKLQPYIYFIYGVLTLICGVAGTSLAPETFNKTLPEIEKIIRNWGQKPSQMQPKLLVEPAVRFDSNGDGMLTGDI